MIYITLYLLKISAIGLCVRAAIVMSEKGGISTHRMYYLTDGEQFFGKVIFTAIARSRMECNQR